MDSTETLVRDVRDALRRMRDRPGFSALAVLTLALGIGVNSAIFALADAALMRPLPFGGTETAGKVASTACGGTWAITPDVLKGKERVRFVGGQSSAQASTRH